MSQSDHSEGLQIQSTISKNEQLEISLATVPTPAPGPAERAGRYRHCEWNDESGREPSQQAEQREAPGTRR